jgi:hypothetical protein
MPVITQNGTKKYTIDDALEVFWVVLIPLAIVGGIYLFRTGSLNFLREMPPESEMKVRGEKVREATALVSDIIFPVDTFNSPAFNQLINFSEDITLDPAGRANPFTEATSTPPKRGSSTTTISYTYIPVTGEAR